MRSHATRLRAAAAASGLLVVALIGSAGAARADPQTSAGLTLGFAETDLRTDGPNAAFHMGARVDTLFLRNRGSDMALGPYLDFATERFATLEPGAGLEWLLPVRDDLPVILSAGGILRKAPGYGWEPGAAGTLFFGSRSYNFHSWYGLGAGVFLQGRYGFGDAKQADAILGAQIDLELVFLPLLFLYEAIAH